MLRNRAWHLALGSVLGLLAADASAAVRRLPAETVIPVALQTTVSSATSRPEDRVDAKVRADVLSGGKVVIPAGSELRGHVLTVRRPGKVKGLAYLSVSFNEMVANGKTYRIATRHIGVQGQPSHGRDAKIIGGGTAAGAIIGGIVNGGSGAKKGAIIGAGAGTGAVLINRGQDVEMPAGSRWTVRVTKTVRLD